MQQRRLGFIGAPILTYVSKELNLNSSTRSNDKKIKEVGIDATH